MSIKEHTICSRVLIVVTPTGPYEMQGMGSFEMLQKLLKIILFGQINM
jgi:hypothetical protein